MSFEGDIRARNARLKARPCALSRALDKLSKADREGLLRCLADDDVTSRAISEELAERGHRVDRQTVLRHRNRLCCR